jgi:O-antigen ligase
MLIVLGFYWGKGAISIGVISLSCSAIIHPKVQEHLRALRHERLAWWSIALFLVYLVSGFWSSNMQYYQQEVIMHLPYLMFPLIFVSIKNIPTKYLQVLLIAFAMITCIGTLYSTYFIITESQATIANYSVGKSAVTPFKSDHIRFGLAVLISILILFFEQKKWINKALKTIAIIMLIWLIIYLHLLASKTSLLCLYLALIIQVIFSVKKNKWWLSILFVLGIVSAPLLAYHFSPTFHTKAHYFLYSLYQIKNDDQQTKVSDEGRIISYQLAAKIFMKNKIIGVGAGDIKDEMDKAYADQFGDTSDVKMLIPHNQFLVVLLIGGLFGLIVFILFIGAPVGTIPFRRVPLLSTFWIVYWIPLLVEPLHEAQLSLTLHLFFLFLFNLYAQRQVAEA